MARAAPVMALATPAFGKHQSVSKSRNAPSQEEPLLPSCRYRGNSDQAMARKRVWVHGNEVRLPFLPILAPKTSHRAASIPTEERHLTAELQRTVLRSGRRCVYAAQAHTGCQTMLRPALVEDAGKVRVGRYRNEGRCQDNLARQGVPRYKRYVPEYSPSQVFRQPPGAPPVRNVLPSGSV